MSQVINIYTDESCHLENDRQGIMVLGAVWCSLDKTREITRRLRTLKLEHGLSSTFEMKWVKVSPAKLTFYSAVLNLFFEEADLHFRALVVTDKTKLDHPRFNQTHDDWYYKIYFEMLNTIMAKDKQYRIFLDYKDTHGARRVAKLDEVLRNNMYDFRSEILLRTQVVRSHEVEIMQLADLLIGIIAYANRHMNTSSAKMSLVEQMRKQSNLLLTATTLLSETKVNLFQGSATGGRG